MVPTPFLATYYGRPIIVFGNNIMLNTYSTAALFSGEMASLRREEFIICDFSHSLLLSGRKVMDPLCSFPPFLVAEKATGDIYLAIRTIVSAALCVKTCNTDFAAKQKIGKFIHRLQSEFEILPPGFTVEVKQYEIAKPSVFNYA